MSVGRGDDCLFKVVPEEVWKCKEVGMAAKLEFLRVVYDKDTLGFDRGKIERQARSYGLTERGGKYKHTSSPLPPPHSFA